MPAINKSIRAYAIERLKKMDAVVDIARLARAPAVELDTLIFIENLRIAGRSSMVLHPDIC